MLIDPEAQSLGQHDDRVKDAHGYHGRRDGARDVAAGVVRLLAQRGCPLETPEGEKPEDRGQGDSTRPHSAWRREGGEREALTARSRAGEHSGEDDHDDDHDQRDGKPLHTQQRAGRYLDVPVRNEPDESSRHQGDYEPFGVRPDACSVQEGLPEETHLGGGCGGEGQVSAQKRPAGEEAGAGTEGHAGEGIDRPRMVEVAREADDGVGDKQDAHRGEQEKNASGTARPTKLAGSVPLRAMAAPGAMMPIDSAIASQKRSSRRKPRSWPDPASALTRYLLR